MHFVINIKLELYNKLIKFGTQLPDAMTRIVGILDLVCLPVLGYTTVKMMKK